MRDVTHDRLCESDLVRRLAFKAEEVPWGVDSPLRFIRMGGRSPQRGPGGGCAAEVENLVIRRAGERHRLRGGFGATTGGSGVGPSCARRVSVASQAIGAESEGAIDGTVDGWVD